MASKDKCDMSETHLGKQPSNQTDQSSSFATAPISQPNGTRPVKYLVVTGGTLSGLGKGTTISSIGVVLKSLGFRVTAIKIDPYLNIDAGTMSPYEHGEVYVLEDGGEVDLDLGNYERFLDIKLLRDHNITTGKIYDRVIKFEREGRYLGKTVQVVPHVTNAVQAWIQHVSHRSVDGLPGAPDICLIEVGGTVGDIEGQMYLEALQQFAYHVGLENLCLCHVSFVPVMGTVGEQKTKPTQHSVKELRMAGLKPDFILCRSDEPVTMAAKQKIALYGQVLLEHVISVHDASNIYHVPTIINQQNIGQLICKRLSLNPVVAPVMMDPLKCHSTEDGLLNVALNRQLRSLDVLELLAKRMDDATESVNIGLVGKYTGLTDSYLSVMKALRHSAIEAELRLTITFIESTSLEPNAKEAEPEKYRAAWISLEQVDGVLCPGGFGDRGIVGKSLSARYCRHNKVPYFGICLGMQTAVIDLCREIGYTDANSEEFNADAVHKVIIFMPEIDNRKMGGTMRLGIRPTTFIESHRNESLAFKLYDCKPVIHERHRHRYEVNPKYVSALEANGMKFVGADGDRMEIAEMSNHPFFICTQFHPEFTSRPLTPNPCFLGFLLASVDKLQERLTKNNGRLLSDIHALSNLNGVSSSHNFKDVDYNRKIAEIGDLEISKSDLL